MTISNAHRSALFLASLLTAAACGGDAAEAPIGDDTRQVTWHQDVAPIIAAHCGGCHIEGGIAPFTLTDYEDAFPISEFLANTVEAGIMPPWSAFTEGDCAPRFDWKEDPRLSDEEMATLRAWANQGAPEGDPETAAALPDLPDLTLSGVTHTVEPDTAYATSGEDDEMICFVMDPGITQLSWLTGMEVVPGDLSVVHHAVVMAVPPAARAEVEAKVGPDGSYPCFGDFGTSSIYPLGVWVPGSLPFETPPNVGTPIAAGSVIVLQIHYHPAGLDHEPERTATKLRLTTQQPSKNFLISAVGNAPTAPALLPGPNDRTAIPEFRIPANVRDHIERMSFPINIENGQRFAIASVFPHMHYIGTKLEATILREDPVSGEPVEECLINVPRWDFDWQRTYFYDTDIDKLPTVGDGDIVDLRCEYDNTLANPFVQRALRELGLSDPIDVVLGEESLDEMCLIGVGLIF